MYRSSLSTYPPCMSGSSRSAVIRSCQDDACHALLDMTTRARLGAAAVVLIYPSSLNTSQYEGDDMMRTDKSKMKADDSSARSRVTIIIGELGFSSDPRGLPEDSRVDRKQHKYAPLIKELEREGWNVRPTVPSLDSSLQKSTVTSLQVFKSSSFQAFRSRQ